LRASFRLDERVQPRFSQERRTYWYASDWRSRDEHRVVRADLPALTCKLFD
jgi:hypothetical protein